MRDRRGFTLIEILIVVAIVAIVATIATTNLQLWQSHYSAVGFQREILSQVNEARTRSMATSLQHRLLIDMNTESVTLQRGNSGTSSTGWTNVGQTVAGSRGAGIDNVICTPAPAAAVQPIFAILFNPNGEVLVQSSSSATTASPLTQADVRIAATDAADQSTVRIYGWTSKARLINGW